MTEILRSPSQLPSSPRRGLSCRSNDDPEGHLNSSPFNGSAGVEVDEGEGNGSGGSGDGTVDRKRERRGGGGVEADAQLSVLALLLTVLRKSLLGCKTEGAGEEELRRMDIGWPTDVRHVAHVTFDQFHGFLGLPVEFEPEVPRRVPSASTTVFGVSTQSMQCSYDSRGNSVPTILLLMQRHLYEQGGLRAEGIFRITAENSQEEYVRDQLNNGIVPEGIDVHCLAGLIKAWFRELPTGVLDSLSSEQVMQCQTEEDCIHLTGLLPPAEAALLDWAVNLMADVVQEEHINKMNARNIATVFAPNMTQMADPLTALMYAVQVMNFLRMLILKTLKDRQDNKLIDYSALHIDPPDKNDHQSSLLHLEASTEVETEQDFINENPVSNKFSKVPEATNASIAAARSSEASNNADSKVTALNTTKLLLEKSADADDSTRAKEILANASNPVHVSSRKSKTNRSNSYHRKARKHKSQSNVRTSITAEKLKGPSIVSRINSKAERVEAWR